MRQQVNLYRDDLRPQREPLQAGAALALVLLAVLLPVLVAVLQQRAVTGNESVLAGLTQQVASLGSDVEKLATELAARRDDPRLEQELTRLDRSLEQRRRLLAEVETLVAREGGNFSAYLAALARQVPPELWLTRVELDLLSDQVLLEGRSRHGNLVPLYLEKLGNESVFEGQTFESFRLARDPSGDWIEFRVGARGTAGDNS